MNRISLYSFLVAAAVFGLVACRSGSSGSDKENIVNKGSAGVFLAQGEITLEQMKEITEFESPSWVDHRKKLEPTRLNQINEVLRSDGTTRKEINLIDLTEFNDEREIRRTVTQIQDSRGFEHRDYVTQETRKAGGQDPKTEIISEGLKTGDLTKTEDPLGTLHCIVIRTKPDKATLKVEKGTFQFSEGGPIRPAFRTRMSGDARFLCEIPKTKEEIGKNHFDRRGSFVRDTINILSEKGYLESVYERGSHKLNDGTFVGAYYRETLQRRVGDK